MAAFSVMGPRAAWGLPEMTTEDEMSSSTRVRERIEDEGGMEGWGSAEPKRGQRGAALPQPAGPFLPVKSGLFRPVIIYRLRYTLRYRLRE